MNCNEHNIRWDDNNPGLLVILIDQSATMRPYENFVTKLINTLLARIIDRPYKEEPPNEQCGIYVISYNETVNIQVQGWLKEVFSSATSIKKRKILPDGLGGHTEVECDELTWVSAQSNGSPNILEALNTTLSQISRWMMEHSNACAPIIVNISTVSSLEQNLYQKDKILNVVSELWSLRGADGNALLFNILVGQTAEDINQEVRAFVLNISSELPQSYVEYANGMYYKNIEKGIAGCSVNEGNVEIISWLDVYAQRAFGYYGQYYFE